MMIVIVVTREHPGLCYFMIWDCYDYEISDWIYQRNHWLACILGFIYGFMIWPQSICEHEPSHIQNTNTKHESDRERKMGKRRKWKSMNGLVVEIWIEHFFYRADSDEMHLYTQLKWSKNFHLTGFDGKPNIGWRDSVMFVYVC